MARISRKTEGAFYPDSDIEGGSKKERTDDVKHSGNDHCHGISSPIFHTLPLLSHLREINK